MFLVRARFTGPTPRHLAAIAAESGVYLGKRGHWCALEKALRFRTRRAAELALDEKWQRLRSEGNRDVILSIVQVPAVAVRGRQKVT